MIALIIAGIIVVIIVIAYFAWPRNTTCKGGVCSKIDLSEIFSDDEIHTFAKEIIGEAFPAPVAKKTPAKKKTAKKATKKTK